MGSNAEDVGREPGIEGQGSLLHHRLDGAVDRRLVRHGPVGEGGHLLEACLVGIKIGCQAKGQGLGRS